MAAVKTAQKKAAPQEKTLEAAHIPPTLTHTGAGDIYVLTDAALTEQEADFLSRLLAYTGQPQGDFAFTTFTLNPQQSTLAADVASLHPFCGCARPASRLCGKREVHSAG